MIETVAALVTMIAVMDATMRRTVNDSNNDSKNEIKCFHEKSLKSKGKLFSSYFSFENRLNYGRKIIGRIFY